VRALSIGIVLLATQMNTLQSKPVVHLQPHRSVVSVEAGGKLLELINAPETVWLPTRPPRSESDGRRWCVDIRNLGPTQVTIADLRHFSVQDEVGRTITICSNGAAYSVKR
jgi:hypothetical protein